MKLVETGLPGCTVVEPAVFEDARGFFYEAWSAGGDEWDRWCVPATDCPHFPPGFLDRERRAMGDYWFRQEYLCEFTPSEAGFFPRRLLDDIFISMEGL